MTGLRDLLASDEIAQRYGCGLHPKLRAAMLADAQFPSHAASPKPPRGIDRATLPPNVTPMAAKAAPPKRNKA